MKIRNWMAALAAGVLLAFPLTLPAGAEETQSSGFAGTSADGVYGYYLLPDGSASVVCLDEDITTAAVPAAIDSYSVTRLEAGCFSACPSLTAVQLPDSVTSYGQSAFLNCEELTTLTIPAGVTLDSYALDGACGLTEILVEDGHPLYQSVDGVLFNTQGDVLIKYPEARPDLSYTVPEGCTTLADWSFVGTRFLQEIQMDHITRIGADAFYYCVALRSARIPEGITELPANLFGCCIALETVSIPSTVTAIGENCFYSCTALREVALPDGLRSIASYAFAHCTALTELTIPASVETVMAYCLGYAYDQDSGAYQPQPGFTLHIAKGSPVESYASSNAIPYDFTKPKSYALYYVLIAAVVAVIAGLTVTIVRVARRTAAGKAE